MVADAGAEAGNQLGGMIEVDQRNDFDGAVHVAVGDRDDCGRHPAAGNLHHVGVVRGRPPQSHSLNGQVMFLSQLFQSIADSRVHVRTPHDYRPRSDLDRPLLLAIRLGRIGGMRDVDRDTDLRVNRVGGRLGAAQSNLLLHR